MSRDDEVPEPGRTAPGDPARGQPTDPALHPPEEPVVVAPPEPRGCPRCGAELAPEQDWCLACGAATTTRIARAPSWRIPVALVAVLALLGGVALGVSFVRLADDSPGATPTVPVGGAAPAPAATAPPAATGPPIATAPAPPAATPTPEDDTPTAPAP